MDSAGMLDVSGIVDDSIVDGPGLRFVLFVQGCPRHCPGCHNPETLPFGVGTKMSVEEVFEKICSNPLVTGVTFSGGEPFCQAVSLAQLGRKIREKLDGVDIACYTGFTFEELLDKSHSDAGIKELLEVSDVLIDGPFVCGKTSMDAAFRGSFNQRILDVPASLSAGAAVWTSDGNWLYEDDTGMASSRSAASGA